MTAATDTRPAVTTDECQDCGETAAGFARPWVCPRRGPLAPHTCHACHDRLDAEEEAEREAARVASLPVCDYCGEKKEHDGGSLVDFGMLTAFECFECQDISAKEREADYFADWHRDD
jgi:NAD-dependent SIR2 family protein deacetylase